MNLNTITPGKTVKAALLLLEMDFEAIQTQQSRADKAALRAIRLCLDQYLRSKAEAEKLAALLQAIKQSVPFLSTEALEKIQRYFIIAKPGE